MTRTNYDFRPILVSYTAEAKANNPIGSSGSNPIGNMKEHVDREGER